MSQIPELKLLERRRQMIAARCDQQRHAIAFEVANIEAATAGMRKAFAIGKSLMPALRLVLALGGLRNAKAASRLNTWALRWEMFRGATTLWKLFSARTKSAPTRTTSANERARL